MFVLELLILCLEGKSLTDFTTQLKKDIIFNMYPNLNDQEQFRLNKINEIKDYLLLRFMKED